MGTVTKLFRSVAGASTPWITNPFLKIFFARERTTRQVLRVDRETVEPWSLFFTYLKQLTPNTIICSFSCHFLFSKRQVPSVDSLFVTNGLYKRPQNIHRVDFDARRDAVMLMKWKRPVSSFLRTILKFTSPLKSVRINFMTWWNNGRCSWKNQTMKIPIGCSGHPNSSSPRQSLFAKLLKRKKIAYGAGSRVESWFEQRHGGKKWKYVN